MRARRRPPITGPSTAHGGRRRTSSPTGPSGRHHGSTSHVSLRPYLGLVTALVACASVLLLPGATASAATAATVEAETMGSAYRYGTQVLSDSAASGGRYLEINSNVTVRKTVTLNAAASSLTVRARTDEGVTPARMAVTVDGAPFPETTVSTPTFSSFPYSGDWAAGRHTVTVSFRNAEARNLYLDLLTFEGRTATNRTPTAAFTVTTSGLSASFDGTGSDDPDGTVTSHLWDFGDGTTGSGPTTGHTYAGAGSYTARLTVTDNAGATASATRSVSVAAASPPRPSPSPSPSPSPPGSSGTVLRAFVTGFDWYDNTPPGSADIAYSSRSDPRTVHAQAGGTGSYADPITVAVGHVKDSAGRSTPDWAAGTRFYLPYLHRYGIVEDLCGDGPTPQNGPCHTGYPAGASTWLDLWVGGRSSTPAASQACMNALTGVHTVIKDPPRDYPVDPGDISTNNGCTPTYADTPP